MRNQRGFALLGVIIIVTVLTVGIAVMLSTARSGFQWGGFFRKKIERQNLAESGINLLKAWLKQQKDDSKLALIDHHQPNSSAVLVRDALCPQSGENVAGQDVVEPSFETYCAGKEDFLPQLYILAEAHNPPLKQGIKRYRLFSQITHKVTGEKYTIETLVMLEPFNLSKIAFGIMAPTGKDFYFNGATFDGLTYFGDFPPDAGGTIQKPLFYSGDYDFKGPVVFKSADVKPFEKGDGSQITFEQGYTQGDLSIDPPQIFEDVKAKVSSSVQSWNDGTELCLFFKDSWVERYDCGAEPLNGDYTRYTNEGTQGYRSRVQIPSGGLVIYSTKNIEVKGIYDGAVTVASEGDIRLGGDIIARKQAEADYTLGLVAKKDIVIPRYVNTGNVRANWTPDYDAAAATALTGSTNFMNSTTFGPGYATPTIHTDRDEGNTTYPVPHRFVGDPNWYDYKCANHSWLDNPYYTAGSTTQPPQFDAYTSGCKNMPNNLDVEGALFAVTGKLNVEGLNDTDVVSTGLTILGQDGNKYTLNDPAMDPDQQHISGRSLYTGMANGTTDAYDGIIKKSDGTVPVAGTLMPKGLPLGRKVDPVYCNSLSRNNTDPCPLGQEIPHRALEWLWLTGGLLVNDFSSTGLNHCIADPSLDWWVCGIYNKQLNFDPHLLSYPPPAFPTAKNQIDLIEQWRKSYVGEAIMVSSPLAEATATPTPTPTPKPLCVSNGSGHCIYEMPI